MLTLFFIVALIALLQIASSSAFWTAVVVSTVGALLQASFLSLAYEIWIRTSVEEATIRRIGLKEQIAANSIETVGFDAELVWFEYTKSSANLLIVSTDPSRLIGSSEHKLRATGRLKEVRIAIPLNAWESTESWREGMENRWRQSGTKIALFFTSLDDPPSFDLVASDELASVIVRPLESSPAGDTRMMVTMRRNKKGEGLGKWIDQQVTAIKLMSPNAGVSLPNDDDKPDPDIEANDALEPETLA